mmetsp:Transcript_24386/g.65474  ORF Transcript_24386/g.65474 Transcript_24386/m.65474 type:complete len:95 (-) Transcript_24386:58-342(-)|eukprot:4934066-Prymnesium_polylepis.1
MRRNATGGEGPFSFGWLLRPLCHWNAITLASVVRQIGAIGYAEGIGNEPRARGSQALSVTWYTGSPLSISLMACSPLKLAIEVLSPTCKRWHAS